MINVTAIATEKDRKCTLVTIETERGKADLYVVNWRFMDEQMTIGPVEEINPELIATRLKEIIG